MVVRTDSPPVRRLQRSALQLLLSVHRVECGRCPANKRCGIQEIAKFLKVGLKPKHLERRLKEPEIVQDHPCLDYYPNRCVLCGKCIHVCVRQHDRPVLTFAKRGLDTVIGFFGETGETEIPCGECLACVAVCPVAALVMKEKPPQKTLIS
jgi:predicted molibdopterin-dependent oxidoreductase YjgC